MSLDRWCTGTISFACDKFNVPEDVGYEFTSEVCVASKVAQAVAQV